MLDIKFVRENKEVVKENIKKKFQDEKLPLVDEVFELDVKFRETKTKADEARSKVNSLSKEIGALMREGKQDEANEVKNQVANYKQEIPVLEEEEISLEKQIKDKMMVIPNIIDESVPIGKDDNEIV